MTSSGIRLAFCIRPPPMRLSITDRSSLALLVLHKLDQHAHDHNKREANIAVLAPVSVKWVACRTNASPEIPSQSTYGVLSNHSDRPHRKRAVGRYAFCRVLLDQLQYFRVWVIDARSDLRTAVV